MDLRGWRDLVVVGVTGAVMAYCDFNEILRFA